ncbi:hypothetical protein ACWEQL_21665 [Kitasatospora sp. NPDC004240]
MLVHGIWNLQSGLTPEEAAAGLAERARPHLGRGLVAAGLGHMPVPEVVMAYYAHVLLSGPAEAQAGGAPMDGLSEAELAEAWEWLVVAGVPQPAEPQAVLLAPLRQAVGRLVYHRTGAGPVSRLREAAVDRVSRLVVGVLREVNAYLTRPEARRAARDVVADAIRLHRPRVVVAHSLGSVVTYEALHAFPELEVELLVTLGSPLGLPFVTRKLEPGPRAGRAPRPSGVGRWVNIADVGDLVALPPELGGAFPVDRHAATNIGAVDFHTLGGYLANGLPAAALAPYLLS